MKRHWMPLYIADYLAGTAHLSTVEHGAYLLLLMHYWSKGAPPSNDEIARRVTRMTSHQWAKSLPILKSLFLEGWRHERLEAELAKVIEKSVTASANARRSHEVRKQSAPESQGTIKNQSQTHIDVDRAGLDKREHHEDAVALALTFLKAVGFTDHSDAPANWYNLTSRAALWIKSGYSAEMIAEEAKIVASKSVMPKPLAYFEKVFATAFARLKQPLPTVTTPQPEKADVPHRSSRRGEIHAALDAQIARARKDLDDGGSVRAGTNAPRLLPSR